MFICEDCLKHNYTNEPRKVASGICERCGGGNSPLSNIAPLDLRHRDLDAELRGLGWATKRAEAAEARVAVLEAAVEELDAIAVALVGAHRCSGCKHCDRYYNRSDAAAPRRVAADARFRAEQEGSSR